MRLDDRRAGTSLASNRLKARACLSPGLASCPIAQVVLQLLFADQEITIFLQPLAEWRLAQQCLVRDFDNVDILPIGILAAVLDQQTLFGEAVDQWPWLGGDLVERRDTAHKLAGRVDLRQMWNKSGARQGQLSLRVFRQFGLGDARRQKPV